MKLRLCYCYYAHTNGYELLFLYFYLYRSQTSWDLKNDAGETLHSQTEFDSYQPYEYSGCASRSECLTFTLRDEGGHGYVRLLFSGDCFPIYKRKN